MQRILFSYHLRQHGLLNYSTRRPHYSLQQQHQQQQLCEEHQHHHQQHHHHVTTTTTTTTTNIIMAEDTSTATNTRSASSSSSGTTATTSRCGVVELVIFVIAIVSGTACSICSKTMMELQGTNMNGETETFVKPIFQTFGMFVGMMFGMIMHWIVLLFKIPFPGYIHAAADSSSTACSSNAAATAASAPNKNNPTTTTTTTTVTAASYTYIAPLKKQGDDSAQQQYHYGAITVNNNNHNVLETNPLLRAPAAAEITPVGSSSSSTTNNTTPIWMYFFLIIPSVFDLAATAFCMMGLRYIDVSIYLLLRGSGIIFVALMKQHVLGDALYLYQWMGVFWNVIAVILVGTVAILNSHTEQSHMQSPGEALLGVTLILVGAFVQALQFVFEEKVMNMEDASVPPLLLIGMEGIWGTFLCLTVVYPIVYCIPGDDHGSYENPFDTYEMFIQTPRIQFFFFLYFFAIFSYNLFVS
jgi:drug/metabolite transporter (DMT)-like permease